MPQRLPRFLAHHLQRLEVEQAVAKAVLEAGGDEPEPVTSKTVMRAGSTAAGDNRRLRGLPAIGRDCGGGAIPGTDPVRALLAKESRRRS